MTHFPKNESYKGGPIRTRALATTETRVIQISMLQCLAFNKWIIDGLRIDCLDPCGWCARPQVTRASCFIASCYKQILPFIPVNHIHNFQMQHNMKRLGSPDLNWWLGRCFCKLTLFKKKISVKLPRTKILGRVKEYEAWCVPGANNNYVRVIHLHKQHVLKP